MASTKKCTLLDDAVLHILGHVFKKDRPRNHIEKILPSVFTLFRSACKTCFVLNHPSAKPFASLNLGGSFRVLGSAKVESIRIRQV